jgi:hypothetical protein
MVISRNGLNCKIPPYLRLGLQNTTTIHLFFKIPQLHLLIVAQNTDCMIQPIWHYFLLIQPTCKMTWRSFKSPWRHTLEVFKFQCVFIICQVTHLSGYLSTKLGPRPINDFLNLWPAVIPLCCRRLSTNPRCGHCFPRPASLADPTMQAPPLVPTPEPACRLHPPPVSPIPAVGGAVLFSFFGHA